MAAFSSSQKWELIASFFSGWANTQLKPVSSTDNVVFMSKYNVSTTVLMMKENPHWVADPVGSVKDSLTPVIINIDLKFRLFCT